MIMRNFFVTILLLSFLVSTTGISLLKHYCGGELAHMEVVTTSTTDHFCVSEQMLSCSHCEDQTSTGGHCEKEQSSDQHNRNCCDNKIKTLKVEDAFLAVSHTFQVILEPVFFALKPYQPSLLEQDFHSGSPYYQAPPSHALPTATRGLRVFVQSFQL